MNNPVNTVLYSLFGIALFFAFATIYMSCGGKKEKPESENLAEKVENVADAYTEDSFFEEDNNETESAEDQNTDISSSDNQTTSRSQQSEQSNSRVSSFDRTPPSPRVYSGQFMVIAGNYLLENNADVMVKKLKASGYNQSEKVVFDLSQYYTVIAGSYDSRSIANSISSELSAKGIENYVLSRKD